MASMERKYSCVDTASLKRKPVKRKSLVAHEKYARELGTGDRGVFISVFMVAVEAVAFRWLI